MEVKEEYILKLTVEYNNTLKDREAVFKYLDKKYGSDKYRVRRAGPKCHGALQEGLMIVEVYI